MSLKRGENLAHVRIVQGILVDMKDCKLEMLVWFILHDMCKLETLFPLLYTVQWNKLFIEISSLDGPISDFLVLLRA